MLSHQENARGNDSALQRSNMINICVFQNSPRAFQALYAGTSGRVSPVDEAIARKVARGTETCAETPRNMVMFTLYHQGTMLGRSCSSISLVRAEALPSCLAAEKTTFAFQVPSKLQELLDDWLYRFICNGRSINRQLLVSSEVSNPDVLQTLELSVVLQIWVWESGLRVLSPKMPLRLVSQDRQGFQLHFVHLPFADADFSNCISLMIEGPKRPPRLMQPAQRRNLRS